MSEIINFVAAPELILNLKEPLRPGPHKIRTTLSLRGSIVDEDNVEFHVVKGEGSIWGSDENILEVCSPVADSLRKGIANAIDFAESANYRSRLTERNFYLQGMSGGRFRAFMNRLVQVMGSSTKVNYLEIGVYKGATFLSALYDNLEVVGTATAIDNWSLFGGPKDEMIGEVQAFMKEKEGSLHDNKIRILESDAFNLRDKETFWGEDSTTKVNLYFYDGPHSYEAQYRALVDYWDVLADMFILVVDDFNFDDVHQGTRHAIRHMGGTVVYERVVRTTNNDLRRGDDEDWIDNPWHNGCGIFLIEKDSTN